jgi:hypothetical protein
MAIIDIFLPEIGFFFSNPQIAPATPPHPQSASAWFTRTPET